MGGEIGIVAVQAAFTTHMRATGEKIDVWPSAFGGKNWTPMSFNPQTGLVYANTLNIGMTYKPEERQGAASRTPASSPPQLGGGLRQ